VVHFVPSQARSKNAVTEASMTRLPRILFLFLASFIAGGIFGQQPQTVQMASLRPSQELVLRRVSPTAEKLDGPVLYQLVFTPGTPGTVTKFDTNPRHLVDSDITDVGNIVAIGGSGFTINANTGIVTFVNGQTFPGTGLSGIVAVANGGTGLGSSGATGNFLRSNGTGWASAAIQAGDLPGLSASYVDLTTVQSVGGTKTFTDTVSASAATIHGTPGHPGGQFSGGFAVADHGTAGAGIVGTGGNNQGANETAGAGVVGRGGNINVGALNTVAGDGGQFTGGDITTGSGTGGNGIVARAGGGGNVIVGLDSTGSQAFAVGENGDVTLRGRISLGIYVISYIPNSAPYDAPCVDANDIAISGGAWAFPPVSLRESRPTGETPTGQKGPAPNAWRVTCTNATGDVNCAQAYVVCLSHASQ
jgi:hypothetical protein